MRLHQLLGVKSGEDDEEDENDGGFEVNSELFRGESNPRGQGCLSQWCGKP